MSLSLNQLARRMTEAAESAGRDISATRHAFPDRRMQVDCDDLMEAGGEYVSFLYGRGLLADKRAQAEFWSRVSELKEQGGVRGARGVSKNASGKGYQGVLDLLTEAMVKAVSRGAMEVIIDEEIEPLDYEQFRRLMVQVRDQTGLDGVSLNQIAQSHRELILELVQNRQKMRRHFIIS